MKKLFVLLVILVFGFTSYAKKVKFAVDLSGQVISPMGVHIASDFQTLAGFQGGDWMPNTTPLTKEGITDIYSIIVDIPAFAKYEYKFLNGDQWYEAEFVPEASRVEHPLNDNRWIYIDSIANDTTSTGALIFGGNAPAGKFLLRFNVDMQHETINIAKGVHVAGNFQNIPWSPNLNRLYSFDSVVYQLIVYVDSGSYEYKFYNGNLSNNSEIVPAICSINGNRKIGVPVDTIIAVVCYADCQACINGISDNTELNTSLIYPNPASKSVVIELQNSEINNLFLYDISGKLLRCYNDINTKSLIIERNRLLSGVYLIRIETEDQIITKRLIFD